MYSFGTNATEICECGIPRITISVNSFTCYLIETTTTHDILIRLRTKYSQLRVRVRVRVRGLGLGLGLGLGFRVRVRVRVRG